MWLHGHEKGHPRIYPSLKGRRKVDVAIGGGGMTGALVASTFAAADVSACLVEAGLVSRGSTAASSALLFAMTPDSLPYIGPQRRCPGHLFALGYGGNGMTFGFIAAAILLEQWRGIRSPDHRLFHFGRMKSVQQR